MSEGLVLVSGVTGFVGTWVARTFIDEGYSVRGTSRTQSKIDDWGRFNPEYAEKIDWHIVEDAGVEGAFNQAVKGVDYVAHTASPFHYNIRDNEKDMLIPAVLGTKNMLSAAKTEPKVKHMVITSSFAAVIDLENLPHVGHTYTRNDWNPATWDVAVNSNNPYYIYCASKAFAEKAAWDDKERQFPVTTICPPLIFGPAQHPILDMSSLNTSIAEIYGLISGKPSDKITKTVFPVGIDVRDVALLHVRALAAPNERFLAIAWHYFNHEVVEILHSEPSIGGNPAVASRLKGNMEDDQPFEHYSSASHEAEELLGRKFIDKRTCVIDTARRLLKLERQMKGA